MTTAGVQSRRASGARVYLRCPTRRDYIARVVAPLCGALAQEVGATRIHLSTGWHFGPHLDLRAEPTAGRPLEWGAVAGSLAAGASQYQPEVACSDAEYLKVATALGRIEGVPPPYLPRQPHGHIELLAPHNDRLATLQQIGRAHLLDPLLATAGASGDRVSLAQVAEAFLALADSHPYGVRFGTFSLRSHAEAFFHWTGRDADCRGAFAARLGKDHAVLEELVRRVQAGRLSDGAAAWAQAFHRCQADFAGQVTDDDLDRPVVGTPRPAGRSPFHDAVDASGVLATTPAWFAGFRLTINLFYQLLPALDVSPAQRFYLCYALAETVDEVYQESWQSRLAAVASMMAAAP